MAPDRPIARRATGLGGSGLTPGSLRRDRSAGGRGMRPARIAVSRPEEAPARARWWRSRTLLLVLAALLPIAVFSGLMTFETLHAYRDADEARLRDTARALAAAVDAQLRGMLLTASAIAESPVLDRPDDHAAFESRATRLARRFGAVVVLLDGPPEHRVLSVSAHPAGENPPGILASADDPGLAPTWREVFTHGLPAVSGLFSTPFALGPVVAAVVPVERADAPRRALALTVGAEVLQRLLAAQGLPAGTFAAIADGRHRIIAHSLDPRGERVGAEAPDWVATAVAGRQRAIMVGPGWSGRDNVYAMDRPAAVPDWTVVVALPADQQTRAAWRAIGWLALGFLAFGLALAALAWLGRREALKLAQREAAALRRGREQMERLHGGLPAVLFLREVAPGGESRLLYRGGDLSAVTGWPADMIQAATDLGWLSHPDDMRLEEVLRRTLQKGVVEHEWRLRQPDGSWRWMRTHCRRLTPPGAARADVVGYVLNITAEREARERALTSARLASLGEMAAGLAHELKQPLQAISLSAENAQFAAQELGVGAIDRRLERIIAQAQRAGDIIEHLRRFARGNGGDARQIAVDLGGVVDAVLAMIRHGLRDHAIELEIDVGTPSLRVLGDQIALEQVMTNLLLNARDALAHQPPEARRVISVTAAADPPGQVTLRVADTGGGIPEHVLPRIFEPFVTTKDLEKGTGLGLAVCHGLVTSMGGSIKAGNGPQGAVMTVTLPAAPPAPDAAPAQVFRGNPVKA